MLKLNLLILILAITFEQIYSQGYYSILAPSTLRPHSLYHVTVSLHRSTEPSTIKLGIISSKYSNFKTIEVKPYSSELVQFQLPSLRKDVYSLTVEGLSGIIFTNETRLLFQAKQLSVFVQTDKAIYKPGDTVRYRVLVLDSNMRPAKNYGDVEIEIRDGSDNLIKKLDNVRLTSSIYSDELELAPPFPALGEWSVNVNVMGDVHKKTFEVAEYVLPKFIVEIDTPKHAIYKDGIIAATVRAKYPFGKPIRGEVTVSVYPKFYGSLQPFVFDLITRKVVALDGKAYVEFDIKNELNFKEDYQRDILLEAIVEEQLSGRKQNTTTVVRLHRDRYNIELLRMPEFYVPNVPFEVLIKVVQHDGSPLKDPRNPVIAYWTNSLRSVNEYLNKTEFQLNNQGLAKLRFTIPDAEMHTQQLIIVSYLDVSTEIGKIDRKLTNSNSYIQAEILNDKPAVNQEINVAVRSNEKMRYFMYEVVGRGDIIVSRTIDVPEGNFHNFKFMATFAMVPKARLLVYFVTVDGQLIFDEQEIDFGDELWNYVRLEAPERSSPGEEIDITITTKPYSYIGLMAVDQNAANIRAGNDLSRESVLMELSKYDSDNSMTYRGTPGHDSGLIILTNSEYLIRRAQSNKKETTPATTYLDENGKLIKKTDIGPAHTFEVNTKPPLAGPYAFSRIPKPFWNRPRVHVMNDVMDTWLFLNISSGNEGRTKVHKKLPHAMTSWVLTGFSLDPVTGLGISQTPRSIEYFKTFYITTDLPYSIKRDEIISIPFVIFNNQPNDVNAEVTFYNTAQDFEFVEVNNDVVEQKPKIELFSRQTVRVPANSATPVAFMVRPKKLGHILIKGAANTATTGDTIEQTLLVEPEGATEYINRAVFIDLRSQREGDKTNVTIQIPKNAIPDSTQIEVSVVGDMLGPTLKNFEKLLQKPSGAGEQNMVTFIPNYLILKHLEGTFKITPAIETKARKYLALGYQRQLFYRHMDGSYSEFGPNTDKVGSTWLTALVARSFAQASKYTEIDPDIIESALKYLSELQSSDGSFKEMGDSVAQRDQSGIYLTSFTLLAFLENSRRHLEYRNVINKAVDYIVRGLSTTEDLEALAISCYALVLANQDSKEFYIERLDALSKNQDEKKWWMKPYPDSEKRNPWYNRTRSTNIEITSYAALAFLNNRLEANALPILRWLLDQRSMSGGFVSSHDTLVGLEALAQFAEKVSSLGTFMQIVFAYNKGSEVTMTVNEENNLVVQSQQLPTNVKNVTVSATGAGIGLAQISYRYNVNVTGAWPRFTLDPQVNRISHSDYLHLSICTSFVPAIDSTNRSNLAIMEVSLPSGFTVDLDTLPSLEANERIKKVETRKRDTVVLIYFDYLDRQEICPTLDAHKTHKVTKHRPAPVIIYDTYDSSRKARMFYNAPKSTLCDICESTQCSDSCGPQGQRQSRTLDGSDDRNKTKSRGGGAGAVKLALILIPIALISLFL